MERHMPVMIRETVYRWASMEMQLNWSQRFASINWYASSATSLFFDRNRYGIQGSSYGLVTPHCFTKIGRQIPYCGGWFGPSMPCMREYILLPDQETDHWRLMRGNWLTHRRHLFQVVELRGDWEFHKLIWQFKCSWKGGVNVGICYRCPAMGRCDDADLLYWNMDDENSSWARQEFNTTDYLAKRLPANNIWPSVLLFLLVLSFFWGAPWVNRPTTKAQTTFGTTPPLLPWEQSMGCAAINTSEFVWSSQKIPNLS